MKGVITGKTGYLLKITSQSPRVPPTLGAAHLSGDKGQGSARTARRSRERETGNMPGAGETLRLSGPRGSDRARPEGMLSNTAIAASDAHPRARTQPEAPLAETRRHTAALRVGQNPLSTGGLGGSPYGSPSCSDPAPVPRRPEPVSSPVKWAAKAATWGCNSTRRRVSGHARPLRGPPVSPQRKNRL